MANNYQVTGKGSDRGRPRKKPKPAPLPERASLPKQMPVGPWMYDDDRWRWQVTL